MEFKSTELQKAAALAETMVLFEFPFIVSGPDKVKIGSLTPYCACISLKLKNDKMEYASGESGVLLAEMSIGSFSGEIIKTVGIQVTGEKEERLLTVKAKVPDAFTVEPINLTWTQGEAMSEKICTLTAVGDERFSIKELISSRPDLSQKIKVIEEGKKYEISLCPQSTESVMLGSVQIVTTVGYPMHAKKSITVGVLPKPKLPAVSPNP